jgi:hypothetical protein
MTKSTERARAVLKHLPEKEDIHDDTVKTLPDHDFSSFSIINIRATDLKRGKENIGTATPKRQLPMIKLG